MKDYLLKKSFFEKELSFDFNALVSFMDKYNLESRIKSNYLNQYILQSTFEVGHLHNTEEFKKIFKDLNLNLNKQNKKSDMSIFFSFTTGASGIMHTDPYDVYIVGLLGNTVYKVNNDSYEVEPGDLLHIPKNSLHKAISLTPRIVLSYSTYEN